MSKEERMPTPPGPHLTKRDRAPSTEELHRLQHKAHRAKACSPDAHVQPLLSPSSPEESKASYFRRLREAAPLHLCSPAHDFDRDGLYIYKRPVRSGAPSHQALLAQAGSVLRHVVVYVKQADRLTALEFGPSNGMDITRNALAVAPSAPVVRRDPESPEPECLPMMHIAAPHHSLDAEHVRRALAFAESRAYEALRNNCIAFADFAVRVLTGGSVRSAPLVFDLVCGQVPEVDSPMLALLRLTAQVTWFEVCDGSRLTAAFEAEHGAGAAAVPVAGAGAATAGVATPAGATAGVLPEEEEEDEGPAGDQAAQADSDNSASTEDRQFARRPKGLGGLPGLPARRLKTSKSSGSVGGGGGSSS